jgi:hypothetical protein
MSVGNHRLNASIWTTVRIMAHMWIQINVSQTYRVGENMAISDSIDLDKVVYQTLHDVMAALRGWLSGQPRNEVAFMNHVTGALDRDRRQCDVGVRTAMRVESDVYLLHRKGKNQVDRYGADLAVTIRIPRLSFVKTAFFQLKRSTDYSVAIERRQLDDASIDPRVGARSFVFAVDEARQGFRIKGISDLLGLYSNEATKKFDASGWSGLTEFLWGWLSCNVGPISKPDDPNSVEQSLDRFRVRTD